MAENQVILNRVLNRFKLSSVVATALLLAPVPFNGARVQGANIADGLRQSARQNLVTVPVQLNGNPAVPFALDSGASSTIINERLASKLRLQEGKTVVGYGAGIGPCTLRELLEVRVSAGGNNVDSSAFAASLEGLENFLEWPINGVVGGALFLTHVVSIDYRTRTAQISGMTNFVPRPNDARILVARSGLLYCVAHAEIQLHEMHWPARLLIDTGALPFEIILTHEFAARTTFTLDGGTEIMEVPGLCGSLAASCFGALERLSSAPEIIR